MTDSLVYLPMENWPKLQDLFKTDWPRGISGYTILETQTEWMKRGFGYGFKVFCPFGNMCNGMVAFNEKGEFYEIVIQSPNDDTAKLEDALNTTKLIDWSRRVIVPFAPSHVSECIKRVATVKQLNIDMISSESFILKTQTALFGLSLPPLITFGPLTEEHIDLVDTKWPHRYPGSTWYFKLLVKTKSGWGLFKNNKLISWVFINEAGTLGHVYTLEEHRRQGYAQLLLKLICNKILKQGKDVFAFAVKGNLIARQLYQRLGFQQFPGTSWCYLRN